MDERPEAAAGRRVWLPVATVRACLQTDAPDADGARLAERVAQARTAGSARAPRDVVGLASLEVAFTAAGLDEWLSAYPGETGQVGALGVLARLLDDDEDQAAVAAQVRAAVDAGELATARTLARGALARLRREHPVDTPTGGLVVQLTETITGRPGRTARSRDPRTS